MALTDLLKSFVRGVTFGAALYSCGGEEKEGCSTDYDCREPRVCVRGYCEGGNGSEGESEGRAPWYDGMCEDFRDYIEVAHVQNSERSYQDCFKACQENGLQNQRYCAQIYCFVTESDPGEYCRIEQAFNDKDQQFLQCLEDFGVERMSDGPN